MSIVNAAAKAEMQLRLDALSTDPLSTVDEILARATEAVGLELDTSNIITVLNAALATVDNTTTSDDIFKLNAARLAIQAIKTPYLKHRQIIESSQNFTVPNGVFTLFVTLVAAGNGGSTAYGSSNSGSGGNAGAVLYRWRIDVTPGQVIPAVIGVGGVNGGIGGNTTFAGLIAKGGEGKTAQTVAVNAGVPSRGGEGFHYGQSDKGAGAGGNGTNGSSNSYGTYVPGEDGVIIVEWY